MSVKPVSAGELNRTVVFMKPTVTRNAEGGRETTYVSQIVARAKIQRYDQIRAIERNATDLLNTDTVWVRYAADRLEVGKDWMVNFDNQNHVIHQIEASDSKQFIRLLVKAGSGETTVSGGSGSGGYLGGGRFDADAGADTAVPAGWVSYTGSFSSMIPDVAISAYTSGNMLIDFGDGPKQYPTGVIAVKRYGVATNALVTVWHDHTPDTVSIMDDNGGVGAVMDGYAGTFPATLNRFNASSHMPVMPVLPVTTKVLNIGSTSLSTTELNNLLDTLVANGQTGGQFHALTSPRTDADLTKLSALASLGWVITAWGVAPNI